MADSKLRTTIKYVVPTTLGSICFFLFTIIDGIFVGHGVGSDGLGAVNLTMPFVMIVNAIFMLFTAGGVTIVAVRFGEGDKAGANAAYVHAMLVATVLSAAMSAIGVFVTDPLCRLLGADKTYFAMTHDYLFWYSVFIIPSGLSTALQGFVRNDGDPILVSVAIIAGTLFNIFGDWLFIFPLGMGLKGAAIATGISQALTLVILLFHFLRKSAELHIRVVRASGALVGEICLRGLPECVAKFATPLATFCLNYVLINRIGSVAVNAFSVISYVASFSVAIFFGTSEGLQPLFGHCYGAKNIRSLHWYFKAGLLINVAGSVIINLLLMALGGPICALFGVDEATYLYTMETMPIYAWGFVAVAVSTIVSAYLYSTTHTGKAVALNAIRAFVCSPLVTVLLPALFGNAVIWWTFLIYETIVAAVAMVMLRWVE